MNNIQTLFQQERQYQMKKREKTISFFHDGIRYTEKAAIIDDAFYEITEGKLKGNLVHVWDIIKTK